VKEYKINNVVLRLKPFGEFTANEEKKIKALIGIDEEKNSVEYNTNKNVNIFPLILSCSDKNFDYGDLKNEMVEEIISDWIVERFFLSKI